MQKRWIFRPFLLAATLTAISAGAADPPPAGGAPNPQAVLTQARARRAVAEYAEAADGFEAFVRQRPQATEAVEVLMDAIVLRLGLGQEAQALADADLFLKNYGASVPTQAAQVRFALGAHAVEHEDYAGAQKRLAGWMSAFEKSAPLSLRAQAHTLLGRTYAKLNQAEKAEAEYAVVRDLWRDPAAATRTVQAEGGGDRQLAKALTSLGEALFFFAEQKRREADAIRFPEYRGKGGKDEVLKHVGSKVAAWVKQKTAAIEEAERAYQQILAIQPMPPPPWVIAAASRDGQLWGKFVAEFRAAPIPKEWKGHGTVPGSDITYEELRSFYYSSIDAASEPLKLRAKGAFKTCVDYSVKFQYGGEYSRLCVSWLARNFRDEYRMLDEIAPGFRLASGAALPQPVPDPR